MIPNCEVETTKTFKLTKKDIEGILIEQCGLTGVAGVTVKFECSGGPSGYDDDRYNYNPMDLYSATITVKNRTKS